MATETVTFALPDRVLLVGDSHANTRWWENVVVPTAVSSSAAAIIQLGDFGWWPDELKFRELVAAGPLPVFFLDGNHEHHWDLRARVGLQTHPRPVLLSGSLWYLPRGSRLVVGDLSVVAVGGARSIDRTLRQVGVDWFSEEALDEREVNVLSRSGRADVLLSHDAPAGWDIPGLLPDARLPPSWRGERPACEEHRARLRKVFEAVEPSTVVHGHYHVKYDRVVACPWGQVSVHGLGRDGFPGSIAILDCGSGTAVVSRVV